LIHSINAVQTYDYKPPQQGYTGPTKYMDLDVAPWNHPTSLATEILGNVKEWHVAGLQLNSPMGKGKSMFAQVMAHHIACVGEKEYSVIWAGANEFKHINKFLESLPKYRPVVIIWDDITSALKQMKDTELHQNFNALTRIRHILDPEKGETPAVIITTGHYSKNVEKEFRNVMEYVGFVSWTNEEQTNMDAIAPKNTQARYELKKFIKLYTKIASAPSGQKRFTLRLGNGKQLEYEYSKPFRPCCVVFGSEAKIILFSKDDVCDKCAKQKTKHFVPAQEVVDRVKKAWGSFGMKALRLYLWKNGYDDIFYYRTSHASKFVEEKLFTTVSTDMDELVKLARTYPDRGTKVHYRPRKLENQIAEELYEIAQTIPDDKSINQSES
jgi:hypothetical protein